MSETENRESAPAPEGEPIAPTSIPSDAAANKPAPATSAPRIAESAFEAAHAELPPLSAIGGEAPVTASETSTTPAGVRRGRGRGAPAGKFAPAGGQPAKVAFGEVENPADMTESLSGKHAQGYPAERTERPARPEREERKPREAAPAPAAETGCCSEGPCACTGEAPAAPAGPKEFVPPVSEGTFKAELNPEAERKAREERRQQQQGNREPRQERRRDDDRRQQGNREPRQDNRQGEQQQRRDGEPRQERRRDEQRNRPGRLTIEAPKIPEQEPTTLFGKIKRAIGKLFSAKEPETVELPKSENKGNRDSRDWQPGRREERHGHGDRRREFRHGNSGHGAKDPSRDGRHRPHQRGGNHRDHHGRDGNPRG